MNDPEKKTWRERLSEGSARGRKKFQSLRRAVGEIFRGMTVHELEMELRKEKATFDQLFLLIVFGDLIGLPLFPPYYTMRLLPYILPGIESWKRSVLREKDLSDLVSLDM
ncbi:MAG TPA: hypothetical protein PLM79_02995 [Syntrophobacteraceae bacterium]|nr:hypothetical protein [Syntrophobacteraceae bacterium]